MKYPVGTQELCITLNSDKTGSLKWYVDAALAAHPGFKSHTGANEKRSNCIRVTKKLNTKSSTEAELVGTEDASSLILRIKLFLEAQGSRPNKKIISR